MKKNEKEEDRIVSDNTIVDFICKAPKILDYEYLIKQEKNLITRELDELKEEYNHGCIIEKDW